MESTDKPTLPPLHTLLSQIEDSSFNKSKTIGQRGHKSDHLSAFIPFKRDESLLLPVFERLSIQSTTTEQSLIYNSKTSHQTTCYIHSRSYSDDSHPYTPTTPQYPNHDIQMTRCHRRATSLDFILQATDDDDTSSPPSFNFTVPAFTSIFKATGTTALITSSTPKTEREYNCTYCTKIFSRPSSLRIHTYSHTGERPFECPNPLCSRRFSVQSNLRRHMRTHRTIKVVKFPKAEGAAGQMKRSQLGRKPLAPTPI